MTLQRQANLGAVAMIFNQGKGFDRHIGIRDHRPIHSDQGHPAFGAGRQVLSQRLERWTSLWQEMGCRKGVGDEVGLCGKGCLELLEGTAFKLSCQEDPNGRRHAGDSQQVSHHQFGSQPPVEEIQHGYSSLGIWNRYPAPVTVKTRLPSGPSFWRS